jgi:hypothetical protein
MVEHNGNPMLLEEAIELFLSEPRESNNGDWSKPTDDDMELLYSIIYELIEQKFERDCDGDLPLKFHVCDRTRFESPCYIDVPHTGLHATLDERVRAMEAVSILASTYNGRLDTMTRSLRYSLEDMTK